MSLPLRSLMTAVVLLCLTPTLGLAVDPPATIYVATTGNDANSGSIEQPLKTIAAALARAKVDNPIRIRKGTYRQTGTLNLATAGVLLRQMAGEKVKIEQGDFSGPMFNVTAPRVLIDGFTLDGRFVSGSRAIRASANANHFSVQASTIQNFTRHAIDIDGSDCQVSNCTIQNILWFDQAQGGRVDAHGVVTLNAQRLTIRKCKINNVSGDCIQADRGNWQDLSILDSVLEDKPLPSAMGGFPKGALTAENGVDTKVSNSRARARIIIRGCRIAGFQTNLITNAAALNLKENIEAVIESTGIRDSEIGLRLRAPAYVTVFNSLVVGDKVAIRYEDGLTNFGFVHNTVYGCDTLFQRAPSSAPWGTNWTIANNLFPGGKQPTEAPAPRNVVCPVGSVDPTSLRPTTNSGLLGTPAANPLPSWYTTSALKYDLAKRLRVATPTAGAFEYVAP